MKRYLVDGYNVIFSSPRLKEMNLEEAREYLISFVNIHYPGKALIVFDGKSGVITDEKKGVVFTTSGSADEYIKKYIEKNVEKENIVVVTRDRSIISYVKSFGVDVMQPDKFLRVQKTFLFIKGVLKPEEARKITKELEKLWVDKGATKD